MIPETPARQTDFDEFSADYDAALASGLSASGENKEYFAHGRIAWLGNCLTQLGEYPQSFVDFGCGIGSAVPFLMEQLAARQIIGLDVSEKSLEMARRLYDSQVATFLLFSQYEPDGSSDLVFCNGVFHHIPIEDRPKHINYIYRTLRPGGLFAFWENNPWNPGTRYVMSRIPFDRDAITLTAPEARRLLLSGGFEILRVDFLFIFPRMLRLFRGIETFLTRLPLGGQYQILCRKPLDRPK